MSRAAKLIQRFTIAAALLLGGIGASAQAPAGNPLDALPRAPGPAAPRTEAQIGPAPVPAQAVLQAAITPTRFDVEGVKSIPFEDVASLFSVLVGKPTTVGAVVEQARKATALYQDRGYALSFVFVPQQPFTGGVVRVVAVEGHVAGVTIDGDAGKSGKRIRDMAARVIAEKPLRRGTFERFTALLGRLPGIGVQAAVPLPTSTDGATTMALQVQRRPYNVSIGTDLRQPQSRVIATGVLNEPLAAGSQLSVSTLLNASDGERFSSVQYTQLLGADGLQLNASVSKYRGRPNDQLGIASLLPRSARNIRRELSLSYPLLLLDTRSFTVSGGFYSVDNIDTTSNPATGAFLSEDARVRAGFVQAAYADAADRTARSASAMLVKGFDRWGAGSAFSSNVAGLSSPGAADVSFTRLVLDGAWSHRFASKWGTTVSGAAQVSNDALPATERISFGGTRFARGYAPGETAGDRGWGAGFEVNRAFDLGGTVVRQVQPYLLLEAARVRGELFTPVPSKLRSLSLGVRLADLKHYTVDFAVSKPKGDTPLENPERKHRFGLQLSWRLGA